MKEELLHFIWKMNLFSITTLYGIHNEKIRIKHPGIHNEQQGPDFKGAQIWIDEQLWAGHVELHIHSSDWYAHHHENDPNYDQVILHVVWTHDVPVFRQNNNPITTIEVKNFISEELLATYDALFRKGVRWINCEPYIETVSPIVLLHWKERLFFERMEERTQAILATLKKTRYDWEATLFIMLARSFGLNVNGEAFMEMAEGIDFKVLRKIRHDPIALEALFLGKAGLLGNTDEPYAKLLGGRYAYLSKKFEMEPPIREKISFFRLRPLNFPTIRLSQLAMLYHKEVNLFSVFMDLKALNDMRTLFSVCTTAFWETHYTFKKETGHYVKRLTDSFIDLLLINTLIPMRYLYHKQMQFGEANSILDLMGELKPEMNSVIVKFESMGVQCTSAMGTQALLHLKKSYCDRGRCLSCAVGVQLLKG